MIYKIIFIYLTFFNDVCAIKKNLTNIVDINLKKLPEIIFIFQQRKNEA